MEKQRPEAASQQPVCDSGASGAMIRVPSGAGRSGRAPYRRGPWSWIFKLEQCQPDGEVKGLSRRGSSRTHTAARGSLSPSTPHPLTAKETKAKLSSGHSNKAFLSSAPSCFVNPSAATPLREHCVLSTPLQLSTAHLGSHSCPCMALLPPPPPPPSLLLHTAPSRPIKCHLLGKSSPVFPGRNNSSSLYTLDILFTALYHYVLLIPPPPAPPNTNSTRSRFLHSQSLAKHMVSSR